jgi:RNA polymerase sigma-70 factor, ECF subfamily
VNYSAMSPEELILSCFRDGGDSAWAEFVHRFHPLIASVVLRVARQWGAASTQVVDDLIQDTYLKLCADRQQFVKKFGSSHENNVYGYIKVFTANLSHDHFKAARSLKRGGPATNPSTAFGACDEHEQVSPSPVASAERRVLIREIDSCLRGVARGPHLERDCRIFWLYYRVGLAASAIAALPTIGLTVKGVESTLQRLTKQVRQRLVSSEQESGKPDTPEKGIPPVESL